MSELIIVSLTTYSKRICNIPAVLETIFSQSVKPDFVVLNLAYDEDIPKDIQSFIDNHPIEVNRVPDTKVYKKLLPTLKKYPEACVITIDDDFLYPNNMIEDMLRVHEQYPNYPISGNRVVFYGKQCHCGCASMVKAAFFGDLLSLIDDEVIGNCPSDDFVYTYFINKAGYAYVRTQGEYFRNMKSYNEGDGYTEGSGGFEGVRRTHDYLVQRFGELQNNLNAYVADNQMSDLIYDIHQQIISQERENAKNEAYASATFKLGKLIKKPFLWFKR